ncbi:predicted protein [Histoplasma capsulatum G186AR]|uniref:Uncharacterized protein n=1 Tax=Ajellomyces capsulatus (strain G186AR / H82 / ATCC MYA-2454 / RMSCC 2432) TaxID=447093 RepID=C0NZT2_AJECG|nr:uncharacterized protein HCBG_08662 [Histoplasma capsulatum G186AR]EEH03022.1 predicted protein [Histoplasma capsulatum G186AR]
MKFSVIVGTFNCVLRIHSTVPRVAKTYKGYKGEVRGFYGLRGSELAAPRASTNVSGHDCGAVLTELALRDATGDGSPTESPRAHESTTKRAALGHLLDGMHILLS